ncbi:hypothetical protein BJV78DRAFT_1273232 [Lactifluus subvellereus]|nr:hypothetical protein BJV78DRAFT_1273232 [Lactifluus subvellereus]
MYCWSLLQERLDTRIAPWRKRSSGTGSNSEYPVRRKSSVSEAMKVSGTGSESDPTIVVHVRNSPCASSTSSASPPSLAPLAAQRPNRLQHARTLTALYTARELIARILPPQSPELSFWDDVLREASDETSDSNLSSKEYRATIVVYAVDEFSGGDALVSALLQDPFSPEVENVRISSRWEGHEQDTRLDIEYASSSNGDTKSDSEGASLSSSHALRVSSSFLASLPSPVQLIELRPTRELSEDNLRLLYTARIPIILLNPLTTPLMTLSPHTSSNRKATVLPYPLPPHSLLLITSPSTISTSSSVPPTVFELGVSPNRVLLVDPARALSSIRALRANRSDALHIQHYSDDALGSGLSMFRRHLQSVPTSSQKGDALVSAAVGMLRSSLESAEAELREASSLARTLRSETAREKEDARRAVFGPAKEPVVLDGLTPSQPGSTAKTGRPPADDNSNKVRAVMASADGAVRPVLDSLTWWRVLWAPDEVGWRMRQAVRDAWVGRIASGLLPALAALPSTQTTTLARALSRTAALPQALRSPVLLNALRQLAHAPSFAVDPRAPLAPLERRLARLLDAGPTAALARGAQVLLLRVAGSVGAGVGTGTGALVLAHGVGEAAGAGLLVAAAGVRWAIGRWDKVRKGWRADWGRVREAAERDVQAALDEALEKQVLIVPMQAAEGIESIVVKREDEIRQLRREVDKLGAVASDTQNLADRGPNTN